MKKTLKIEGMSCQHCVMAVKRGLTDAEGVNTVEVDLEKKTATLEVDGVSDDKLKELVEEAGYKVVEVR